MRRGFVSSASVWEPAAKAKAKTSGRSKTSAKSTTATKKKPAKKAAPKAKKAAVKAKPKTTKKVVAKPKSTAVTAKMRATVGPIKRAPTPFAIFSGKFIKASAEPKSNITEVGQLLKEAGRMWRNFGEVEKKPFYDEYAKLRAAYLEKEAAWSERILQNHTDYLKINRQRTAKGRRAYHLPKAHRRPASGFMRFSSEVRPTIPDMPFIEKAREVGKRWKALSDSQKKVYSDQYIKEMAEFRKQHNLPPSKRSKTA